MTDSDSGTYKVDGIPMTTAAVVIAAVVFVLYHGNFRKNGAMLKTKH